jgi:hypothetical protein
MIVSLFPSSQFIDRSDSMFRGKLSATGEVEAIESTLAPDASGVEFECLSLIAAGDSLLAARFPSPNRARGPVRVNAAEDRPVADPAR